MPLMTSEQVPQIPSRQSCSKAIGSFPCASRFSLTTSSISRNDISGETPSARCVSNLPSALPFFCRQTWSVRFIGLLVAPLGRLQLLEDEGFFMASRLAFAAVFPHGRVHELRV